jgi:hypothetical protein
MWSDGKATIATELEISLGGPWSVAVGGSIDSTTAHLGAAYAKVFIDHTVARRLGCSVILWEIDLKTTTRSMREERGKAKQTLRECTTIVIRHTSSCDQRDKYVCKTEAIHRGYCPDLHVDDGVQK